MSGTSYAPDPDSVVLSAHKVGARLRIDAFEALMRWRSDVEDDDVAAALEAWSKSHLRGQHMVWLDRKMPLDIVLRMSELLRDVDGETSRYFESLVKREVDVIARRDASKRYQKAVDRRVDALKADADVSAKDDLESLIDTLSAAALKWSERTTQANRAAQSAADELKSRGGVDDVAAELQAVSMFAYEEYRSAYDIRDVLNNTLNILKRMSGKDAS